jgi:hypothetical protein
MDDRVKPIISKIQLFSGMICVLVDVLCHRSPFYTKKDCQAQVPAETQTSFCNLSMKGHKVSCSDLRESWKTWARENYHELAGAVVDLAASAQSNEQAFNEMEAEMMERIGASPR